MTTTQTWTVLDNVRTLAPEIDARAGGIAALRRLPPDLVAKLKASGAFSRAFTYGAIDELWEEATTTGQVSPERRRAMMESLSF
jgi:hypothetical protein